MSKISLPVLLILSLAWRQAQSQWVQTSGPAGDTVNCMATIGTDLFAGTNSHGVFRSPDNGVTWIPVSQGLPNLTVLHIVARGAYLFAAVNQFGMFRSSDDGGSWAPANTGMNTSINCLAAGDTDLFAGTTEGLFRSSDDGSTWTFLTGFNYTFVAVGPRPSESGYRTLFAQASQYTNWPLLRSTDNGATFTPVYGPCTVSDFAVMDTTLFLSYVMSADHVIVRSTDNGTSWTEVTREPFGNLFSGLAVSDANLFAGMRNGLCRSSDRGYTWENISTGLTGRSVLCLATVGQTLFAGTAGSGVFLRADSSPRWFRAGVTTHEVFALAAGGVNVVAGSDSGLFRSTYPGTIWASAGLPEQSVLSLGRSSPYQFAGTDSGLFRSPDGATWTSAGLTSYRISALALIHTADTTYLFAGTSGNGVFCSTDDGQSWPFVNHSLAGYAVNCLAVKGADLFAGVQAHGVYRSTDNGASWTSVSLGMGSETVNCIAVGGASLFAGTDSGGVYRSTDEGTSWVPVTTGVPDIQGVHALTFSGTDLYAGTSDYGVFRSTDNGSTWTDFSAGLAHTNGLHVLSLAVMGNILYAGTYGGVFYYTFPSVGWTSSNTGLTCTVMSFLTLPQSQLFAADACGGMSGSTDDGQTWWGAIQYSFGASACRALASQLGSARVHGRVMFRPAGNDTTILFAGTGGGGVYRSADTGKTWTATNAGLTNLNVHALAPRGSILFAGTEDGVFRSTDVGITWGAVNAGLTGITVHALAVTGTNLFAGTGGGGMFLSTDNGISWTGVNDGLTNTTVLCLAVDSTSGTTSIYAGTDGGGVFLSGDYGGLWGAASIGLTNTTVHALALTPGDAGGTNLFAGTDGGVFQSTDNGSSWTAASTGMTNTVVNALGVHGNDLYAGTLAGGVFRRPLPAVITSVERPSGELPEACRLEQNYPNPFNPSTTIRFELPHTARVSLNVYNVLGQRVATLVDEEKPAGVYNVRFDGAGLASGVYFYTLRAGDFAATRKFLLLR